MCGSLLGRGRGNGIDVSGQRQRKELGNELELEMFGFILEELFLLISVKGVCTDKAENRAVREIHRI